MSELPPSELEAGFQLIRGHHWTPRRLPGPVLDHIYSTILSMTLIISDCVRTRAPPGCAPDEYQYQFQSEIRDSRFPVIV